MPFSAYLIISLVGGLVLSVLIKLLFNKITGRHASDFSRLDEFFGIFITCSVIILVIMLLITLETVCAVGY